jgi:hypothetical protein
MAKRMIQARFDEDLLAAVDQAAGPRGRTAFLEDAARAALTAGAGAPRPASPARAGWQGPQQAPGPAQQQPGDVEPRFTRP